MVNSTWATTTEWATGGDLGSDHLSMATARCCQVPSPSVIRRRASWNILEVNWQGFAGVVNMSIAAYPLSLRDRVLRLNRTRSAQLAVVKTMEHVIHNRMYYHAKTHGWLCPEQVGFGTSRSCKG